MLDPQPTSAMRRSLGVGRISNVIRTRKRLDIGPWKRLLQQLASCLGGAAECSRVAGLQVERDGAGRAADPIEQLPFGNEYASVRYSNDYPANAAHCTN